MSVTARIAVLFCLHVFVPGTRGFSAPRAINLAYKMSVEVHPDNAKKSAVTDGEMQGSASAAYSGMEFAQPVNKPSILLTLKTLTHITDITIYAKKTSDVTELPKDLFPLHIWIGPAINDMTEGIFVPYDEELTNPIQFEYQGHHLLRYFYFECQRNASTMPIDEIQTWTLLAENYVPEPELTKEPTTTHEPTTTFNIIANEPMSTEGVPIQQALTASKQKCGKDCITAVCGAFLLIAVILAVLSLMSDSSDDDEEDENANFMGGYATNCDPYLTSTRLTTHVAMAMREEAKSFELLPEPHEKQRESESSEEEAVGV